MERRRGVIAIAVAMVVLTAGCGFITGQDSLEFSASPATVSGDATSETGYEETTVREQVENRTFSVADQERTVEVTNHLAQYERSVDLGPLGSQRAGVFVAFTSPQVEVLDQTFNPIAGMSERQILQQFENQYSGISVGSHVENRSVSTLGQSTALEKFEGSAALAGSEVDVYIHATKLTHDDDHVVAVAIYPQQLDGEEQKVITLLEGLEH